jgi:hypothetical protein
MVIPMKNAEKRHTLIKRLNIISAIMGFLGAFNSIAIGFFLLSILFDPLGISNLMIQGYLLAPVIAVIIVTLIYGSYLILKNRNTKRGARVNLASGLILAFLYVYYAFLSKPILLGWLNPVGISLIIPPLLSGIIGQTALTQ